MELLKWDLLFNLFNVRPMFKVFPLNSNVIQHQQLFPIQKKLYISLLYSKNNVRFLDTEIFPYLRLQNFAIAQFCESKFTTIKSLLYIQLFEEYTEAILLFLFPQCEMLLLIKKEKSQRRGGQSFELCSLAASWLKYN